MSLPCDFTYTPSQSTDSHRLSGDPLGKISHTTVNNLLMLLTVPSIATQYTQSRSLHDKTAREWTRLYARPPPPPPALVVPPSTRSKGKDKEVPQSDTHAEQGARPQDRTEVINIDDSDDETAAGPVAPNKQGGVKRKREGEVIDVDGEAPSGARTRRRRTEPNSDAASEVIVIED